MRKYTILGIIIISILIGGIYSIIQNQREVENLQEVGALLILGNEIIEDTEGILIEDENIYFSIEFIEEHFDSSIYVSEDGKRAFIDLSDKDFEMEAEGLTNFVMESGASMNIPLKTKDYTKYLPANHLGIILSIDVNYNEDSGIVVIDRFTEKNVLAAIKYDNVVIYSDKSVKSRTIDSLNGGDKVKIISKDDEWFEVRTGKGYFGYVERKNTDEALKPMEYDNRINYFREQEEDSGRINITWEYVHEKTPDISDEEKIEGLDVVSPTWFSLSEDGVIINNADFNYVKQAHEKGYKVWGLVDNSFDPKLTSEVVNNKEIKDKVIAQIAFYSSLYDLDGINIDFENIYYEDKDAFAAFIEDLTYILKKQNLIVSIDVTVPGGSERWSKVYDRERLAKTVDYVALMAYDEHWSTSPVSGSVASIGWVEKSIKRSLESIPKEKLLLGVPFYTRVWKETKDENGKIEVSSKAVSIKNVKEILDKYDADVSWDEATGQYFATYEKDDAVYKIWIEDTESIKLKLELAKKYGLKGIASWRKGYEYEEVWEVINEIKYEKELL